MPSTTAKRLRTETGYPWQDCIAAAARTATYQMARELVTVIHEKRTKGQFRVRGVGRVSEARSDGRHYCPVTKPTRTGELRCDLPEGHPGDKHAQALMNPFFPGVPAFIHEWTSDS